MQSGPRRQGRRCMCVAPHDYLSGAARADVVAEAQAIARSALDKGIRIEVGPSECF